MSAKSLFAPVLTGYSGIDESSSETGHNGLLQTLVCRRTKGVQGVDIARGEIVEAELDRLIAELQRKD